MNGSFFLASTAPGLDLSGDTRCLCLECGFFRGHCGTLYLLYIHTPSGEGQRAETSSFNLQLWTVRRHCSWEKACCSPRVCCILAMTSEKQRTHTSQKEQLLSWCRIKGMRNADFSPRAKMICAFSSLPGPVWHWQMSRKSPPRCYLMMMA